MKTMNRVPWVLLSLCILAVLAGGLLSGADDRGNEGAPHRAVNEAGMEIKNVPSPAAPVSGDVPEGGKNDEKGLRKEEKSPPPGPYVSIVIDDFGFSRSIADEYKDISLSLTWSIIPFQTHSAYAAELAEESGIPYMVHMPMSAVGDKKWSEKRCHRYRDVCRDSDAYPAEGHGVAPRSYGDEQPPGIPGNEG